jgi:hypothetical protein
MLQIGTLIRGSSRAAKLRRSGGSISRLNSYAVTVCVYLVDFQAKDAISLQSTSLTLKRVVLGCYHLPILTRCKNVKPINIR